MGNLSELKMTNKLQLARDLIADKNKWCQKSGARDNNGNATSIDDEKAVSFCIIGAIRRACNGTTPQVYHLVDFMTTCYKKKSGKKSELNLITINDNSEHQDVIDLFDYAIKQNLLNIEALKKLKAAREKITDPVKWCKKHFCLNAEGKYVWAKAPEAVQWCAMGAVQAFCTFTADNEKPIYNFINDCLNESTKKFFHTPNIVAANDALEHQEILKIMDHAITELEKTIAVVNPE